MGGDVGGLMYCNLSGGLFRGYSRVFVAGHVLRVLGLSDFSYSRFFSSISLRDALDRLLSCTIRDNLVSSGVARRSLFSAGLVSTVVPHPDRMVSGFGACCGRSPRGTASCCFSLDHGDSCVHHCHIVGSLG